MSAPEPHQPGETQAEPLVPPLVPKDPRGPEGKDPRLSSRRDSGSLREGPEGATPDPVDYEGRRHPFDGVAAWTVSLVFHAVLVAVFMTVSWLSAGSSDDGTDEFPVGVITDDERAAIEPGEARPVEIAGSDAQLKLPEFATETKVEPIPAVGRRETASGEREPVIGLDLGASGASSAMKGDWGALAGGGGLGGGGGGTSFFGLQARGGKFVFLIDRSGSMRGEKFELAREELLRSIGRLTSGRRFYVIFFDHGTLPMKASDLVRATPENKDACTRWVNGVSIGGGTDPTDALKLALSLKPNTIWLLSDGMFQDADKALAAIGEGDPKRRVQIHTIAYFSRAGEEVLRRIAQENHGQYRFVSPTFARDGARRGR